MQLVSTTCLALSRVQGTQGVGATGLWPLGLPILPTASRRAAETAQVTR